MDTNNNSKIDDFILGRLPEDEAAEFRVQLTQDIELQLAVAQRRELIDGIETHARQALKQKLQNIHTEAFGESPATVARVRPLWPRLAAAATILLLIAALGWWFWGSGASSPEMLYVDYYAAYDLNSGRRSDGEADLRRIEELYRAGDYAAAWPLLQAQLQDQSANTSEWLLVAGIMQLELNQPATARQYFQQILDRQDFNYADQARWYSALAYLKESNVASAQALLQSLAADSGADHHAAAVELLDALDDLK